MLISKLQSAIEAAVAIRHPLHVWGDPGVGKTAMELQVADKLFAADYEYSVTGPGIVADGKETLQYTDPRPWYRDFRASTMDPVDIMGIPVVENGRTHFKAPSLLPVEGTGMLVLEEYNRGTMMMQNAFLSLLLERRIGEYHLPEGWLVIVTGNFEEELGVNKLSSASRSRLIHVEVEPELNPLLDYAAASGWNPMVMAFLRWRPEIVHVYNRKQSLKNSETYPCPRTWEFVSSILNLKLDDTDLEYDLIKGSVGEAACNELVSFIRLYRELPDLDIIRKSPDTAPLPKKPATAYALASALARIADTANVSAFLTYLMRFASKEFAAVAVKEMTVRDSSLFSCRAVTEFQAAHADLII